MNVPLSWLLNLYYTIINIAVKNNIKKLLYFFLKRDLTVSISLKK